ncbi:AAA family ATPase [Neotabrizicola sp. sgz301269]|uniref:AAA family ATPase n=1 Tax=Neotabrizicola sp. sgz301269 TaxID=3276282 RepID=UPI00376F6DED
MGYLYPNGFSDPKGQTFYVGNIGGDAGESLNVVLTGPRAGLWHDFATADGGDIFDLWQAARGLPSFRETIRDAGLYSGAASTTPKRMPKRKQPSGGEAWGAPVATYRYTDAMGNIVAEVERFEWEKDGKKAKAFRPWDVATRRHRAPETRPLYNLPNIATAPEIVVVEGEKAADALIGQNIDATTAMGGAAAPLEKTDWSVVRGRRVVIWPDNDAPGRAYADRLKTYLEAQGAQDVTILSVPANRPEKWDAADAEDEDLGALIRAMRSVPVETSSRLKLENWSNLQDVAVQWLVRDLIPQGAMAALYGKPGSYKSFVALYIAAMVANGADCFMRPTRRGAVVYVMGEGGAGAYRRAKALQEYHGIAAPEVYFLRSALNLRSNTDDANALIAAIGDTGTSPALVVIDTLARNFGGGNENSSEDMGAFIGVIGHLQETLGCAVLLVHHSGKDEAKGMRGHSSLFGAVDTELEVVKISEEDDPRRIGEMTVTKQKDGDDGFKLNYEMHLIEIGPERTSLALEPVEGDFRKAQELKPTARQYLDYITAFFAEPGSYQVYPPMPGMPAMRTAKLDAVRQWCRKADGVEEGQEAAQRQRWSRTVKELRDAGKIGIWDDKLWLL